jgi:F-type H+-transporting ATPase subunit epsilon
MAKSFQCKIVTPAEAAFAGDVDYVTFPAWDGQMGVMHGQSPVLTRLGIGPMRMDLPGGESRSYLIEGGFAQIQGRVLTVLTERATSSEDVTDEGVEEEIAEANTRAVTGSETSAEGRRTVEAAQQRARARRAFAASRR